LKACHPALVRLLDKVQERVDIKVGDGHLDKIEQGQRYSVGNSRLLHSKLKHNSYPCMAVNMVPLCGGAPSHDEGVFLLFACVVFECAAEIGVRVRWGGNSQTLRNMQRWELMTDHD
tara:strand:+ start:3923 stop:4273 length:351 start_codon:yes stop_codon:yes gene_type:complete